MTDIKNFVKTVKEFNSKLTAKTFTGSKYDFINRVIVYYFVHHNAGIMFPDKEVAALFDAQLAEGGFKALKIDKEAFLKMISSDEDYVHFKSVALPKNGDVLLEKWCRVIRSSIDRSARSIMSPKIGRNALPKKAIEKMMAEGLYKTAEEAQADYVESLKQTQFIMGTFTFMRASSSIFDIFNEQAKKKKV